MLQHNHENDKNSFFLEFVPQKSLRWKKANEGGVILFKSAMKKLWEKNKNSKRKKRRGRRGREKVRRDKVRRRKRKEKKERK